MSKETVSAERVAALREKIQGDLWYEVRADDALALCDTVEQLRSDLASMTKERDEARRLLAVISKDVPSRDWQRYLSTAGAASRPPELSRPDGAHALKQEK